MLYTNNYIHEAAEPSKNIQVVILANSLDDGTAAKVMSDVCDFNDTATTEIYTRSIVGSVRCV